VQIQDIPRAYVRTTLRAIRMPIDLSESIARRNGDDRRPWPPAVVFDAVQGGIKKAIGSRLDAVAQESLARKERASRARQIETERRAIAKERRAVASEAAVADLDAEIEASKQARQSD